jgi:hypothetical protein
MNTRCHRCQRDPSSDAASRYFVAIFPDQGVVFVSVGNRDSMPTARPSPPLRRTLLHANDGVPNPRAEASALPAETGRRAGCQSSAEGQTDQWQRRVRRRSVSLMFPKTVNE